MEKEKGERVRGKHLVRGEVKELRLKAQKRKRLKKMTKKK